MAERTASCSCKKLIARTTEEPIRVSVCHCLACQLRTGSVFGVQARFRGEAVSISGESRQFVREADEGGKTIFHFCPHCGATVFYLMEGIEDCIGIPVGAFADPTFPSPSFSVYEDRMHPWVTLPQDMEHTA